MSEVLDVAAALEGFSEQQLLEVLQVNGERQLYVRGIEQGRAGGYPVEILVSSLAGLPPVSGLEALRASRKLEDLLLGRRWHIMRQARAEGSTWSEIGDALGMSKQAAQQLYRRKIESLELQSAEDGDLQRARAALDDLEA